METKILVPLDGSRLSEQSLPYAMTLGQRLPAELVLLSAVSIPSDTLESLEKKIHKLEHRIYPQAIQLLVEGRLSIEGRKVRISTA